MQERRDARHAAWLLNGVRAAIYTENWKEIDIDDLIDPNVMTEEEAEEEREYLTDAFPATMPD